MARAIPPGFHTLTPYLMTKGTAHVIDFLKEAFDAEEIERHLTPDGKHVMHAQLRIGDSMVMLAEATEQWPPMPAMLYMYLPNVDEAYRRAIEAGAKSLREPRDEFYGDRSAGVQDSAGNRWWIATHKEDVPPKEMERRVAEFAAQQRQ
jgi:PhnB protein